jgi:hypothetical protein
MTDDWDSRVKRLWSRAADERPDELLAEMRSLAAERPIGNAVAAYELASAYDFLGREAGDRMPRLLSRWRLSRRRSLFTAASSLSTPPN